MTGNHNQSTDHAMDDDHAMKANQDKHSEHLHHSAKPEKQAEEAIGSHPENAHEAGYGTKAGMKMDECWGEYSSHAECPIFTCFRPSQAKIAAKNS